jgi:hypothetical protein
LSRFVEQASRLKKRSQLFIRVHNETFSVAAKRISNEFSSVGIPQQSPLLEQVEKFKDDHDNDNYSDYIEDSVHVGANIRVGVWWPAFILAHMML